MENGEDFMVEYFDGSTWNIVASYARGTDFENNGTYAASISIDEGEYTFPSDMNIRFRCDASGNADDVYIDEIKITASTTSTQKAGSLAKGLNNLNRNIQANIEDIELNINLYPVPASGAVTIDLGFVESLGKTTISITDIQGKVVYQSSEIIESQNHHLAIDVNHFNKGLYLVLIQNNSFTISKKLIVE